MVTFIEGLTYRGARVPVSTCRGNAAAYVLSLSPRPASPPPPPPPLFSSFPQRLRPPRMLHARPRRRASWRRRAARCRPSRMRTSPSVSAMRANALEQRPAYVEACMHVNSVRWRFLPASHPHTHTHHAPVSRPIISVPAEDSYGVTDEEFAGAGDASDSDDGGKKKKKGSKKGKKGAWKRGARALDLGCWRASVHSRDSPCPSTSHCHNL